MAKLEKMVFVCFCIPSTCGTAFSFKKVRQITSFDNCCPLIPNMYIYIYIYIQREREKERETERERERDVQKVLSLTQSFSFFRTTHFCMGLAGTVIKTEI